MGGIILVIFGLLMAFPAWVGAGERIDQAGRLVKLPERPVRVIALAPSLTEIVYDLGREDLLVGATQFSNHPPEAARLPKVGSYVRLDLERIVALRPDLCLAIKDGNPLVTVNKIESFGIPVYVVDPRNINEIIEVVERFGDLLGAEEAARRIGDDMRRRLGRVARRIARSASRPAVFFQIDAAPMISAGRDTFIDELINLAGGRNLAAAGSSSYPRFNWEEILSLRPEVVIVASMAGGHSPADLISGWRRWPMIPAVRDGRVHVVDANLVDRPTPRLVEGLEVFSSLIHPELTGGSN